MNSSPRPLPIAKGRSPHVQPLKDHQRTRLLCRTLLPAGFFHPPLSGFLFPVLNAARLRADLLPLQHIYHPLPQTCDRYHLHCLLAWLAGRLLGSDRGVLTFQLRGIYQKHDARRPGSDYPVQPLSR